MEQIDEQWFYTEETRKAALLQYGCTCDSCCTTISVERKDRTKGKAEEIDGIDGHADRKKEKLYHKYRIGKANGGPIDPTAQYFVLRVDTDPAAQAAMLTYAAKMKQAGEVEFAEQIRDWIASLPAVKPADSKNTDKENCVHPKG